MAKMIHKSDPLLKEIVSRLVELYTPERIYLFGSTARGTAGLDSDYDIMVVVPDSTPVKQRDPGKAYVALWDVDASTDVLVWTQSYFDSRLRLKASLPTAILNEGQLLYEV